ncbi:hypothetical protein MTO98_09660 [Mucilaginibacter sp. SMC90]|uniref:hypothetical protein n=1 Tax=Mucilaginibacter sp. SMC90 TaxID=2929803 RepID=UPI001FB2ADAC|nr:hypothetical protein [Mucilaginibacter sp. SMC90]UOE51344.1 hypothetical protein MTO98_09660 [Mucilaginibacter sp. SMC90]
MLKGITWGQYLIAAVAIMLLWYAIIAVLYYRKEIKAIFKGKLKLPVKKEKPEALTEEREEAYTDPGEAFDELESIAEDIKISILEKAGKVAGKEELLGKLKERLANYGGLRQPAFRMAMNNFIIQHSEDICGVAFSEHELDEAWQAIAH